MVCVPTCIAAVFDVFFSVVLLMMFFLPFFQGSSVHSCVINVISFVAQIKAVPFGDCLIYIFIRISEFHDSFIDICSSMYILFHPDYNRRYWNLTSSALTVFRVRRLYCRWGIAPRPEDIVIFKKRLALSNPCVNPRFSRNVQLRMEAVLIV